MSPDLKLLCEQVQDVAREAGHYIAGERLGFTQGKVEVKSLNSLVSYVDRTAEELIVSRLSKLMPEAGFITEEETTNNVESEYTWIIDPLDGTTNFIHGIPCFCVSIALVKNRRPIAGVVYEVNLKECFSAWEGGGAFLNGEKIQVSETSLLSQSLIATGFPYYDYGRMDEYLRLFSDLMKNSRGLRRLGSAATDLAYVAAGRFDAFYEYGLNSWDVAAGILIVQEAGGMVSDFKDGDDYLFGKEIIASNGSMHKELAQSVTGCFGAFKDSKN